MRNTETKCKLKCFWLKNFHMLHNCATKNSLRKEKPKWKLIFDKVSGDFHFLHKTNSMKIAIRLLAEHIKCESRGDTVQDRINILWRRKSSAEIIFYLSLSIPLFFNIENCYRCLFISIQICKNLNNMKVYSQKFPSINYVFGSILHTPNFIL